MLPIWKHPQINNPSTFKEMDGDCYKLGDSVAVYKTISTTHIAIFEIPILLREKVDFHRTIPTTHVSNFKYPPMTNGEK